MNLLYANDRRGAYPPSWYAATAEPLAPFPKLTDPKDVDLCIIGAGFTGLSAALAAREAWPDAQVAVLEAQRVGFGASGRNGGQVGSGQREDQTVLEKRFGKETAMQLWQIAEDAKADVKRLIARHKIDGAWRDGLAYLNWTEAGARGTQEYARHLRDVYGADHIDALSRDEARALVKTDVYHGGMIDWTAGHIHPLRFVLGLAHAARKNTSAVTIHEATEVVDIKPDAKDRGRWVVKTKEAQVNASYVLLATNGYHGGLSREVSKRVMPINNFIIATEPLGDRAVDVLAKGIAVGDSKFVINYYRLSEDKRLLFGGGESYGDRFPADVTAIARKPMLEVFPQLKDVKIDYAWGGTLGITPTRLPYFAELMPGLWTACGYSGQGVALGTLAGRLVVEAIRGDRERFDLMAKLRPPAFPGLDLVRRPLLNAAMRWFAFLDRFER